MVIERQMCRIAFEDTLELSWLKSVRLGDSDQQAFKAVMQSGE